MSIGSEKRYWILRDEEAKGPFSRDEVVNSCPPDNNVKGKEFPFVDRED